MAPDFKELRIATDPRTLDHAMQASYTKQMKYFLLHENVDLTGVEECDVQFFYDDFEFVIVDSQGAERVFDDWLFTAAAKDRLFKAAIATIKRRESAARDERNRERRAKATEKNE